jgi:hypothetical protein
MILVNRPSVFEVYNIARLILFVSEPMLVNALFEHTVQLCVLSIAVANYSEVGIFLVTAEFGIQFSQHFA